jgi:hypothetical protein
MSRRWSGLARAGGNALSAGEAVIGAGQPGPRRAGRLG